MIVLHVIELSDDHCGESVYLFMGKIIENYELKEQLGEGVYAKVYKAVHLVTKQEVAIKVVQAEKFKQIPKL